MVTEINGYQFMGAEREKSQSQAFIDQAHLKPNPLPVEIVKRRRHCFEDNPAVIKQTIKGRLCFQLGLKPIVKMLELAPSTYLEKTTDRGLPMGMRL